MLPDRPRNLGVPASLAYGTLWILALIAFVILAMQRPEGTAPSPPHSKQVNGDKA